jgi:cytochrome c oxidase subunit II
MRLREFFNIKTVAALLVICTITLMDNTLFAKVQDSTVNSTTAAIDTAAKSAISELSPSNVPLISTAVDTVARYKNMQPLVVAKDYSEAYRSGSYYLMMFFLLCIFIAIIGKIVKVYEISREMQGQKSKFDSRRINGVLLGIALIAGIYGVYWSYSVQGPMSMHESASVHGLDIDYMFNITLILTTIVFILTHIALFGFSFQYRGSENRKAYFYPHNNSLERIWTIIPAIVLTVLVLLGFFTWRGITNVSPEDQMKAINIEVTGEQFKWSLRYAGADNQIGARNYKLTTPTNGLGIDFKDQKSWDDKLVGEIVIPVNKPVRFTVGSKDVLHSFYLPDFRAQINAVPGMPTYFQFTPRLTTAEVRVQRNNPEYNYVLLCAKNCGAGHYNMQAKVTVVSEAEYATWLAKQALYYNDDAKKELQMVNKKATDQNNKIALNTNSITK